METTVKKETFIETELKKFNVADAAIAEMKENYSGLTIAGINDKEGFNKVHDARMLVRGKRIEVEKKRKELKEDSLKFGRAVDAEAKRITSLLEEIEAPLHAEEMKIEAEKERIKQEAERKEQERIQKRIDAFSQYNYAIDYIMVKGMTDEQFSDELARVKDSWEKEQQAELERLAEIERQKKEEQERLAAIKLQQEEEAKRLKEEGEKLRIEREKIAKEQAENEAAIKAERDAIENEKRIIAEAKRKEEEEQQRKIREQQIAENARIEAEQKLKREAEEKAERERLAKVEEERQLALRPDKEKLRDLSLAFSKIQIPVLSHPDAKKIQKEISTAIANCVQIINDKIESL